MSKTVNDPRVSTEAAIMLKRLGFDWGVFSSLCVSKDGKTPPRMSTDYCSNVQGMATYKSNDWEMFALPSLWIAAQWLEEVHNIFIEVYTERGALTTEFVRYFRVTGDYTLRADRTTKPKAEVVSTAIDKILNYLIDVQPRKHN